jgi:hypothetical protein
MRQADHAHAVLSGVRELEARLEALTLQELVRNLKKYSCPVSCVRLAAFRSAMEKIHEYPQGLSDNCVRFASLRVDNKADPASVAFELRIVQALF